MRSRGLREENSGGIRAYDNRLATTDDFARAEPALFELRSSASRRPGLTSASVQVVPERGRFGYGRPQENGVPRIQEERANLRVVWVFMSGSRGEER